MLAGLTAKLIAGGAALALLVSMAAGIHLHGRKVGAENEAARWQAKVQAARLARDVERRQAVEALSMQALEFAKQEAVLRQRARETANALEDALAANSGAITACDIPGELFDAIFGPASPGGTGPNPG